MPDTDEQRCPNCDSPDLVVINTKTIADDVLECQSCSQLYAITYTANGSPQLVPV